MAFLEHLYKTMENNSRGLKVKDILDELKIKFSNSTPSYPQCKMQTKVTNKIIMNGIKKKLIKAKGKWVDKLPNVFWVYQTTP